MSGVYMRALGFDYGIRRIGVAAGQTVTATASPLGTISVWRSQPDWPSLNLLIRGWEPDALVVGLPINGDGTEHKLAPSVMRFVRQLRGRYNLPVYTVDERLSSCEARVRLAGAQKGLGLDAVAAQVILETWFSTFTAQWLDRHESSDRIG